MASKVPPSTADKHPAGEHFDKIVQVTVGTGEAKKTFEVHKGVICFYSAYFQAAFNGSFWEADRHHVTIAGEDPTIFQRVYLWVYSRRLCGTSESETSLGFQVLIKLWVFGDAHLMPLLQNTAANLIVRRVIEVWIVPTMELLYIYQHTTTGAGLRRLVIDVVAKTGGPESILQLNHENSWCKQSLLDLVRVTWGANPQRASKDDLRSWDMCAYHVHEDGVKCATDSELAHA